MDVSPVTDLWRSDYEHLAATASARFARLWRASTQVSTALGGCACSAPGRGSSPSRRATCGNVVSSRRMHPPRRRPRRGCLPRYGNGLAAGAIARPKTGGHDPPFRGQCRSV